MIARSTQRRLFEALLVAVLIAVAAYGSQGVQPRELAPGVGKVKDGDSFVLRSKIIRLYGIDAPEYRQTCEKAGGEIFDCGKEAANALRTLIRGQKITCTERDRDRYRRSVSVCRNETVDLNAEMVRRGWAVAYRRHSQAYVAQEREAKMKRIGIWQGSFDMPEDYRNQRRNVQGDLSGMEEAED